MPTKRLVIIWVLTVISARAAAAGKGPPAKVIAEAQALFDDLEYEAVLPLIAEVLAEADLDPELKLDAYLLQAKTQVVLGQGSVAEQPFRLLFRARPDFDLPAGTSPKILAVWRKVQVEEAALRAQLDAVQRERLIAGLTLVGGPIPEPVGGVPLRFELELGDPDRVVNDIRIGYRKTESAAFSEMAMEEVRGGTWRGVIPGEWTVSETGLTLEYFIETRDSQGPLLLRGSATDPLRLQIRAGALPMPEPVPEWVFWTGVGTAGGAAITGTLFALLTLVTQDSYQRLVGSSFPVEGRNAVTMENQGRAYSMATNAFWITSGVLAVATGLLYFFTSFGDDEGAAEVTP